MSCNTEKDYLSMININEDNPYGYGLYRIFPPQNLELESCYV